MEKLILIGQFFWENGAGILVSASLILGGLLGIAMLIPGEQPDKFLKAVLGVIEKLSIKKKK